MFTLLIRVRQINVGFQNNFFVYQIKGFQCLISNKIIRLPISRGQILNLLLAIIQDEKNSNKLRLELCQAKVKLSYWIKIFTFTGGWMGGGRS